MSTRAQAAAAVLPPVNSPFIIGLSCPADLDSAQLARLVDSAAGFLRSLRHHLPNTDVRVMADANCIVSLAIMRVAVALDISVDALIAGPLLSRVSGSDTDTISDLRNHSRVRCIEVGADNSCTPQGRATLIGDILVRRSSLMIALWDGSKSSSRGDTADIVFGFLGIHVDSGGTFDMIEIDKVLDEMELAARLVYWVPVIRSGASESAHIQQPHYLVAAGDNVLEVQESMPLSLKRGLADLNEYNAEFERVACDGSVPRSESLMRNFPEDIAASDAAVLEDIDRQYVKADTLAGYMQWRSDILFNMFGIMTFSMGLAYLIYDKITESRILLIVYMLILLTSLLAFYVFQAKRWFSKYLSTRVLAETLRVRFYLTLAGLDRGMRTRALIELTGLHRFRGFSWISFALDSIEPTAAAAAHTIETHAHRTRFVNQAWIEDQYQYFARKVAAMERARHWIKRLKSAAFIAVLIVISVMFMFGHELTHVDARVGLPVKNILTFCSGFLAVVLGVWELRQNKMAAQELLWQYRSQLSQFQRARMQFKRVTSRTRRDVLLKELGENSLMEIYLWAIHRYHREHAPPASP